MRTSLAFFLAVAAVMLSTVPQLAEAGPCSGDIAELETTIRQPGVKALGAPEQHQSTFNSAAKPTSDSATGTDKHLQSQFSATVARAKRLDAHGDRFGCIGALNAARRVYVLVDKQ